MIPTHRIPTHPGEILLEEFLKPLGLSQAALARHLDIPLQRVNEIVRGKRGISPETAWLLAGAFGTTPDYWVNMQTHHDLAAARPTRTVKRIRRRSAAPQVA
jgi:addiction module HigA family antidote